MACDARLAAAAPLLAFAVLLAIAPRTLAAPGVISHTAPAARKSQPLYRANPARTGYVERGPEPPLKLRWKFKTRRGVDEIESFPAVDDGLSGASADKGVVYVGGHDGW